MQLRSNEVRHTRAPIIQASRCINADDIVFRRLRGSGPIPCSRLRTLVRHHRNCIWSRCNDPFASLSSVISEFRSDHICIDKAHEFAYAVLLLNAKHRFSDLFGNGGPQDGVDKIGELTTNGLEVCQSCALA